VRRNFLGRHFIAEFYNCSSSIIDNVNAVEKIMTDAALLSGTNIIRPFFHTFSPQGVSGIIVISESHFAVHTWPEHSYAAVDLFSCSDFNYRKALTHIRDEFKSQDYSVRLIKRGLAVETGEEDQPAELECINI